MTIFKIGKITVVCESSATRSGFKHNAVLLVNGYERIRKKCCYLNRTWEQFTYGSVLAKILEAAVANNIITKRQTAGFVKKYWHNGD